MNKKKRVQFDIRGKDADRFRRHVEERKEPDTVVLRDIVRQYYSIINTKYNE